MVSWENEAARSTSGYKDDFYNVTTLNIILFLHFISYEVVLYRCEKSNIWFNTKPLPTFGGRMNHQSCIVVLFQNSITQQSKTFSHT